MAGMKTSKIIELNMKRDKMLSSSSSSSPNIYMVVGPIVFIFEKLNYSTCMDSVNIVGKPTLPPSNSMPAQMADGNNIGVRCDA